MSVSDRNCTCRTRVIASPGPLAYARPKDSELFASGIPEDL